MTLATAKPAEQAAITDAALEAAFVPDESKHGRQFARFAHDLTPLHPVLNDLRRTGDGVVARGDVAEAARGWGLTEEAVRAGIRFYERHREISDAFFLRQDEEWREWEAEQRCHGSTSLRIRISD